MLIGEGLPAGGTRRPSLFERGCAHIGFATPRSYRSALFVLPLQNSIGRDAFVEVQFRLRLMILIVSLKTSRMPQLGREIPRSFWISAR